VARMAARRDHEASPAQVGAKGSGGGRGA
jgi:hypothetical protein